MWYSSHQNYNPFFIGQYKFIYMEIKDDNCTNVQVDKVQSVLVQSVSTKWAQSVQSVQSTDTKCKYQVAHVKLQIKRKLIPY